MVDLSMTFVLYKNYKDLIKALQSYEEFASSNISREIYIVDNSADDAQWKSERADLLAAVNKYKEVVYINPHKNLGYGRGNNFVINKLDSKYHAIINPDIIFMNDPFENMIQYLEANKDVGMCIPKIIDLDGNIQPVYRRDLTVWDMFVRMFAPNIFKSRINWNTMQDMDYSRPFQVPFGQGSFLLIRTNLFRKLKGFDERYFMYVEDADLCKRVNQVSKLMYFPYSTVIHVWKKSSHKDKKLFVQHLKSAYQYFMKWGIVFK